MKEGFWVTTFTGGVFSYTNPRPEDIDIRDIAWSLSNLCRWGGHTSRFYSVAQHSIMCAHELAKDKLGLHGLMHDAAEAYIGDIPHPLKQMLGSAIEELEANIFNCIDAKFNLVWTDDIARKVKVVDDRMLCTEARELTKWDTSGSKRRALSYQYRLPRWSRETTLQLFMENFGRWTGCKTEESLRPYFREMLDESETIVPARGVRDLQLPAGRAGNGDGLAGDSANREGADQRSHAGGDDSPAGDGAGTASGPAA